MWSLQLTELPWNWGAYKKLVVVSTISFLKYFVYIYASYPFLLCGIILKPWTILKINVTKWEIYSEFVFSIGIQRFACIHSLIVFYFTVDLVELNSIVTKAFDQHGLRSNNEELIDVGQIIDVLMTIFEAVEKNRKGAITVPLCVDMTLNWLLNVYDRYVFKIGKSWKIESSFNG